MGKTDVLQAASMDMASFKRLALKFSPDITIRIRGRHGIGKSQSVYQLAREYRDDFYKDSRNAAACHWSYEQGLPVTEVRLSQCTEGDIQGLPVLDGNCTSFKAVDWILKACKQPVVLFLDELNRSIPQVEQAVFQILDSHRFGEYRLHPGTRVFVAENVGDIYQVGQVDPAELSRCAVIDLSPTNEDWLVWARDNCHALMVDFIRANPQALETETGKLVDPLKKTPDRRAWARLDTELRRSGLYDDITSEVFYHMTGAMIGTDFSMLFWKFCKEHDKQISAEDILKSWAKCKAKLGHDVPAEKFIELVAKVTDWCKKNEPAGAQVQQIAEFMRDCPPEPRMAMWAAMHGNQKLLVAISKATGDLMVRTVTGAKVQGSAAPQAPAPAAIPAPKRRR